MSTIFLGNLARDVRQRDVEDFFHGFGVIRDINIKSGFAFIEFQDRRDAADACRRLDGRRLMGDRVTVEMSNKSGNRSRSPPRRRSRDRDMGRRRSRSPYRGGARRERPERTKFALLIKNLSSRASWMDLKDLARKWGHVTFADANKQAQREGVVSFSNKNDLKKAYEGMQGYDLHGRSLEVDYEFPEVMDEDWNGEVNNDHPSSHAARGRSRSRSPQRRDRSDSRDRGRFADRGSRSPGGRFSRSRSR